VRIQFLGAARQVTGSQYCVEADGIRLLVDCGMFQERAFLERNWEPSVIRPRDIDAMLLTHAHVDHCGLAPRLVREGFHSPIYTTSASADLVPLVLRDAAQIQEEDTAYKRKRHRKEGRKGKHPETPLYTLRDVERTLPLLRRESYEEPVRLGGETMAVFHDAGHILGSAMIELRLRSGDKRRRVIFSGDIGQWERPIVRDPTFFSQADYIVMESTYGDRVHANPEDVESRLAQVIGETVAAGGNVVIPIFAIERAQELTYYLSQLRRKQRIPPLPVFLDSPMAADVTAVFGRHRECFDLKTWQRITVGDAPFDFAGFEIVHTLDESKAINRHKGPAIIMSTSGMCTAGRVKFHLRQNIFRPECTILFVGFQAEGTLGRQILDGNPEVRIHGRPYQVNARVEQIQGFSGHADRDALLRWLRYFHRPPRRLFLVHGEEAESLSLAKQVREEMGWEVLVPEYRQTVDLE